MKNSDNKLGLLALVALILIIVIGFAFANTNTDDLQGFFRMNARDGVSRGELAQVIANQLIGPVACNLDQTFNDVEPHNPFHCGIDAVVQFGIMQGFADDSFQPESVLSRAEAASAYFRALSLAPYAPPGPSFNDVNPGVWYYEMIEALNQYGLFDISNGNFYPNERLRWRALEEWFNNV